MKQPKNSLQLPKPTRNTRKIANKFMTVASGEMNLQAKQLELGWDNWTTCSLP